MVKVKVLFIVIRHFTYCDLSLTVLHLRLQYLIWWKELGKAVQKVTGVSNDASALDKQHCCASSEVDGQCDPMIVSADLMTLSSEAVCQSLINKK